jgi:S-adenosyl-L-methionine hydrolase (adenosine-forming)
MKQMHTIALLTDFSTRDWYVASMKAVILSIKPDINIIDITHDIPAGDIRAGAFTLLSSFKYFPAGTIFCAVVDPGVGSIRLPIAIKTSSFVFVGPDNGIFSFALSAEKDISVRSIDSASFHLPDVSAIFHGRDIFAPAAAHLASGKSFESIGRALSSCVKLDWEKPTIKAELIRGKVIYIDRFGNAITNIRAKDIQSTGKNFTHVVVTSRQSEPIRIVDYYQQAPLHSLLALVDSSGFLEIAVNGGSAAESLKILVGDEIEARV